MPNETPPSSWSHPLCPLPRHCPKSVKHDEP
uniref:Uncharacterized protein n=1 Tax=Anguilla anguilla TaxID=7936 RepID=A0A0E9U0A0_ANGAN